MAPKRRAVSSFEGTRSTTVMVEAPLARQAWTWSWPMGPAPKISTSLPSSMRARSCPNTTHASGSVNAASPNETLSKR